MQESSDYSKCDKKISKKKYYISSDSESESDDSSESYSSDSESASDESANSNKKITVKKCKTKILTSKIRNMEFSISKILQSKKNKSNHIDNLTRENLVTLKSIIKGVKQLKNVKYVREKTITAFKKCNSEIEQLLIANKKSDIKTALKNIGKVDDFVSFQHILLGNKQIYTINKKLATRVSKTKNHGKYRKDRFFSNK